MTVTLQFCRDAGLAPISAIRCTVAVSPLEPMISPVSIRLTETNDEKQKEAEKP